VNYRRRPTQLFYTRYSQLYQDYDQPGGGAPSNDFRVLKGGLGCSLNLTPRTVIDASAGYYLQSFQNSDNQDNEGYISKASLETRTEKASFNLEARRDFYLDYFSSQNLGSSEFDQVLGATNYQLTEQFSFFASASYRWEDFLERDRKDEIWQTNARFNYSYHNWLTLSLSGGHIERDSTDPDLDFTENRFAFLLTLTYPNARPGN
jgi:hypothetical protein